MDGSPASDTTTIIQLIILVILLILSGLFSSAETALTTVSKYKMKALAEEGSKRAKVVLQLIEKPGKMLSAILIGNNIVNLTASSLTTIVATKVFGSTKVGIATGILTILILIFGEITPKNLATIYNVKFALFYAWPIRALSVILTPFIWVLDKVCHGLYFLLRIDPNSISKAMTESELRTILDASHEDGVIEEEEKDIITNVVDFGDSIAKDIMIPRTDITMAPVDASLEEVYELFQEEQFSRLPIYEENKDNIIGILHMKDLFFAETELLLRERSIKSDNKGIEQNPCEDDSVQVDRPNGENTPEKENERSERSNLKEELSIRNIMREPHYTYEFQKTSSILEELREHSLSITIVLNEYGASVGMITIEDLLEEIVGEIRDEYDEYEEEVIKQVDVDCYEVDGSAKIDDVNDALDLTLESEDYDSIGGYVIELLDHLPEIGEVVTTEEAILEVLQADKTRVERVLIKKLEPAEEA